MIDPPGFALENFDAIGRWRDVDESSQVVDASGMLPDGTKFNGVGELRAALLNPPTRFVTTLTEKLFTYALGRGLVKNEGETPAVATVLKQGADPNGTDAYGSTALHWAVELDNLTAVDLLLKAGANPSAVNRYNVAPLSVAAEAGNAAVIMRLLNVGANPNTVAAGGETALTAASRSGNVEAVKALLARGADVNARESVRGQTALMWAAAEGHAAVIAVLVEAGAEITARSRRPTPSRAGGAAPTPSAAASEIDAPPATRERRAEPARPVGDYFVRSNGGVLNTPMVVDSMTPLMFAVRAGRMNAVRTLLDNGASATETAPNGLSVLVLAIINAHYELAGFLLDRGADPNAAGQGWTALYQVVATPRLSYGRFPHPAQTGRLSPIDLAKKLIAAGADVNPRMTVPTLGDGYRRVSIGSVLHHCCSLPRAPILT
jgi:uncharacterized protein